MKVGWSHALYAVVFNVRAKVIDSRKKIKQQDAVQTDRPTATSTTPHGVAGSLFSENAFQTRAKRNPPAKRLTAAELRQLEAEKEAEIVGGWKRLLELWPAVRSRRKGRLDQAGRDWMVQAGKMADTFRETRLLFTQGKVSTRGLQYSLCMLLNRLQPVFMGMMPRRNRKPKKQKEVEEEEDRMASRLHLDLG